MFVWNAKELPCLFGPSRECPGPDLELVLKSSAHPLTHKLTTQIKNATSGADHGENRDTTNISIIKKTNEKHIKKTMKTWKVDSGADPLRISKAPRFTTGFMHVAICTYR